MKYTYIIERKKGCLTWQKQLWAPWSLNKTEEKKQRSNFTFIAFPPISFPFFLTSPLWYCFSSLSFIFYLCSFLKTSLSLHLPTYHRLSVVRRCRLLRCHMTLVGLLLQQTEHTSMVGHALMSQILYLVGGGGECMMEKLRVQGGQGRSEHGRMKDLRQNGKSGEE